MEDIINKLKEDFPNLDSEKKEYFEYVRDDDGNYSASETPLYKYFLTQKDTADGVTFIVDDENDAESLSTFLSQEPVIYKDYVGVKFHDMVEVMLTSVSRFGRVRYLMDNPILIHIMYKSVGYNIEISGNDEESPLMFLVERTKELRRRRARITAKISTTGGQGISISEQEVREMLFSVLFDIEYTYDISLDTVKYDSVVRRAFKRNLEEIPSDRINLVYKKYTPELIEYFHTAEKVDYLPFKYICYFHIIEYFMDKTAYMVAAKKVKQLLLKPDFHANSNKYINDAINIFKKENDKYQTDVVKVNRVFKEFVGKDEILSYIKELELDSHFSAEVKLESDKNFSLSKVRFDNDNEFYNTLSRRIYSLRCSIVHSNPDFDENKAIPFIPTEKNLFELRKEIELIKYIAKNIVATSLEI
ncbi:hypothetical protein QTV34_000177 [Vibrio parahaemolyticus]|nr:hypothetical protein [Vibrio parahaemolyticus]